MEAHGQKNKNKEGILTTKLLLTSLKAPSFIYLILLAAAAATANQGKGQGTR